MTPNDLRVLAQTKSGQTISEPMGLTLTQEAIDLLSLDYYLIGKLTIEELEVIAGVAVKLSRRPLKIIAIYGDNGTLSANTGYDLDDRFLYFKDDGKYKVKYYAEPIKPEVSADTLSIPYEYQNCISYYIAAITRGRLFGQDDSNAVSFYQQFNEGALKANNAYIRKKTTGKRLPPRR